jgi:hypothetical protein
MSADFSGLADDFFINLNLQTTLSLPSSRESLLHFCEAVQREFSSMTAFYERASGEFILEGDRESGSYRWMEISPHRLAAGHFNPPDLEEGRRLHEWLLDRSVYFLGVSPLDVEALDVLMGFNLDYRGNRDAIVAQALLGGSPMGALLSEGEARCVEFEPSLVVALNEECYLQARLSIETRSNSYQVRTGNFDDEPISIYFTLRRYPKPGQLLEMRQALAEQLDLCEELTVRQVIPQVISPVASAIAGAP